MTTVLTEGRHAGEFMVSEANGMRSRETIMVKSGRSLEAGTILILDGAEAVAYLGTGDPVADAIGVLWANVDATDAAVEATYIARDAEVNRAELVPIAADGDGSKFAAAINDLAALNIIAR